MGISFCLRIKSAAVAAALVCLCLLSAPGQGQSHPVKGEFKDPTIASGKPVVLIFLRTDCPVSNRYAPTIQSLAAKYEGRVAFWLVYPSKDDSEQRISAKLAEYGYKLPWMRDPSHVLVAKAKATITPEAALFDATGQLRYHGRIDDLYVAFGRSRRSPTTNDLDEAVGAVLAGTIVSKSSSPAVGCYISDLE